MTFLLSFAQLVQPGILVPALRPFKPMLVLSVLAGLVALATRPLDRQLTALFHPVFVLLVLFFLAQGASVYYSGVASILETLGWWSIYPVFVLLAGLLIADLRDLRRFVWGMILGGQVVILYGFFAMHTGSPTARAYGMYENHNDYTYVIILVLPFVYTLRGVEERFLVRLLLLVMLAAGVMGVILSLSRWGMITLALEAALLVAFVNHSIKRAVGLVVLGLLGTFAIEYQWAERAEIQGDTYTVEDAKALRIELWKAGKKMFLAHPLLGVGSNRFGEFSRDYAEISHDNWGKNAHNTYVEVLAVNGLAGFLPFAFLLLATAREFRQSAGPGEEPTFMAIRVGARISFYAIMFRALTNAKPHDWSFYMLAVIAISCAMLREQAAEEEEEEAETLDAPDTGERAEAPLGARPG